jgi:thiol-disulfide isomerase/thioredoxin
MDGLGAPRFSKRLRLAVGLIGLAALAASGIAVYLAMAAPAKTSFASTGSPRPVPDLQFQDGRGNPLALSDFRGRAVLLNVWATWCTPCREEMPTLDRLQQKLGGPAFEVLALSIDNGGVAAVRRFFEEVGVRSLSVYVDPSMRATEKLRIVGVPTTLLIDREGRELWRKTGPAQWDSPEVVQVLRAQIREERTDAR